MKSKMGRKKKRSQGKSPKRVIHLKKMCLIKLRSRNLTKIKRLKGREKR